MRVGDMLRQTELNTIIKKIGMGIATLIGCFLLGVLLFFVLEVLSELVINLERKIYPYPLWVTWIVYLVIGYAARQLYKLISTSKDS